MDDYVYDFGMTIKMLRENRGWSQKQLADRLGISKPTVSAYENNYVSPSFEVIRQLSVLFRVTSDYLLGLNHRHVFAIERYTDAKVK